MAEQNLDALILQIAQGSREALHELYEALHAPVYRFALSMTKEPYAAEDIMQNVFLQVMAHAGSFEARCKAQAWVFAIAHNLFLMEVRKNARLMALDEAFLPPSEESFEDRLCGEEASLQLLALLSEQEREMVALHLFGGLRHYEIAAIVGLSYPQVRYQYARAIKKLRSLLQSEGSEWVEKKTG